MANRLYLIVFSDHLDRDRLIEKFNSANVFWFYNLPNTIFIQTPSSSKQLSDFIEKNFGVDRFLVTEIKDNFWGRLPTDHWKYFPKQ